MVQARQQSGAFNSGDAVGGRPFRAIGCAGILGTESDSTDEEDVLCGAMVEAAADLESTVKRFSAGEDNPVVYVLSVRVYVDAALDVTTQAAQACLETLEFDRNCDVGRAPVFVLPVTALPREDGLQHKLLVAFSCIYENE